MLGLIIALAASSNACSSEVPAGAQPDIVTDTATADRIIHAIDLVGTPYHRRGTSPETGFDCSGFIGWIFRDANGIQLPRSAHEIFALGKDMAARIDRDDLAAGDLVFFRIHRLGKRIDHVGMYVGEGRFIHSPASGGEVRIDPLAAPYWAKRYAGARRILIAPQPSSPSTTPDTMPFDADTTRENAP